MADSQQAAIYEWEDEWASWNASTCSLAECRQAIRDACITYGLPKSSIPAVTQHKHTEMSYYDTGKNKISLRYDHKNVPIACHEAAHAIIWYYFKDRVEDHGPEFMGIYLCLLIEHKVAPRIALMASLTAVGIQWDEGMLPCNMPAEEPSKKR